MLAPARLLRRTLPDTVGEGGGTGRVRVLVRPAVQGPWGAVVVVRPPWLFGGEGRLHSCPAFLPFPGALLPPPPRVVTHAAPKHCAPPAADLHTITPRTLTPPPPRPRFACLGHLERRALRRAQPHGGQRQGQVSRDGGGSSSSCCRRRRCLLGAWRVAAPLLPEAEPSARVPTHASACAHAPQAEASVANCRQLFGAKAIAGAASGSGLCCAGGVPQAVPVRGGRLCRVTCRVCIKRVRQAAA